MAISIFILTLILLAVFNPFMAKSQTAIYDNATAIAAGSGRNVPLAITNGIYPGNDGKAYLYSFNDTSTATPNGTTIIQITGRPIGRWLRMQTGFETIQGLQDSITARLKVSAMTLGLIVSTLGYTPANAATTLNINGTTQDLSANRTWTVTTGSPIYGVGGLLAANSKTFSDTISISSATPTISLASYLSAMGCTNFKVNSVTGYRSGATALNSPQITVTATTSNSVSLIATQANSATVVILGISVLSGAPSVLVPDPTNIKIFLSFTAW